jgi:hypothetical protein
VSAPVYRSPNSGSIVHGGTITGPRGGTVGGVSGPRGGGAAGVRGPRGGAAGAVWGPDGRRIAGARGPYGNRTITTLPPGAVHYPWRGDDYWHSGFGWWRPCWVDDDVQYNWVYPPIGYYYPMLPDEYDTVVIDDVTYYESDGVYYQQGVQDGEPGYIVAEAPAAAQTGGDEGENPFDILKRMCDYVAGLETFTAVAEITNDEFGPSGEKIQVSSRRKLYVQRPDKVAVDVTGDTGGRRAVYDGKTFSMLDRKKHYYSVVPVPDTIDAALDTLAREHGIVVQLEHLLYKNLYERAVTRVSTGQDLGWSMVGNHRCHHLAFSSDTSNWEIWIEAGDKPVPRKITIDSGQQAARSRYSAEIVGWNASPAFDEETFEFKLPENAQQLKIASN